MNHKKLECLVEGYEGTYFEVGQVWETRGGDRLKVKGFDLRTDINKLIMAEVDDPTEEMCYNLKGGYAHWRELGELVKLISTDATPSKESQPKTLSEYLKENNAYESFIENCVARALLNPERYEIKRGKAKDIDDYFIWDNTKEGYTYWDILQSNIPKPIEYDMNEIIFAEVDKTISKEEKSPKRYMLFVEGKSSPKKIHTDLDTAEEEAKRLATQEIGSKVFLVEIVKEYKSRLEIDEL